MRSVQVSKPKGPLEIVEKDIPPEKQREERWRRPEEYVEGIRVRLIKQNRTG
jgi:hypothetical protein